MSEAAALIQVSGIKKVYKMSGNVRVNALNGVSFRVERGEFIAIMGTSGSGKSTLLHLIAGVDTPTSGTVRIDGQDIHRLKPSGKARLRRRSVGIIYQDYNLIPTLTVEENIILPILLDRRKPDKGEVERLLDCSFQEYPDWDDYDTLGGLLIAMLDRIPGPKEHPAVELDGVRFTVQRSNNRQVLEVLAERLPQGGGDAP